MKTGRRRALAVVLAAILALGLFAGACTLRGGGKQAPLDTDGALVSLTQNGDTIVFNPDGTYAIQGDVEIEGTIFTYTMTGTYSIVDGKLVLNEENPLISVDSPFGSFELPGSITAQIVDGALIIHLEASNESDTFELAHFSLGTLEADALGLVGITADSWSDGPSATKAPESSAPRKEPELDADGALLTIESAGNRIAFFPDGTFKLIAAFTQSDDGIVIDFDYELEDTYKVENGKLILPSDTTGLLNSDFIASYGYTDVETPTRCTAEVVDGLLELRFIIQTGDGEKEIAVFKIGQKDAEKIGVLGVTGETVIEGKAETPAYLPTSSNNAPSQPAVAGGAKPLSFSNGGYTITFYSNGQYRETGTVYAGGATVSVTVTDTYTINSNGTLSLRSGNQVSCFASMGGYNVGFGAPNNTSCRGNSNGYTISFQVPANGQTYHVGTVRLSANDVKRIQENFGLKGESPKTDDKPAPEPTKPTVDPTVTPTDEKTIRLTSEAGIDLVFYPESKTFDVTGKTVMSGIELAAYSLTEKGTFSTEGNCLTLNPATLKITALNDMAKPLEGETGLTFSVAKGDDDTLTITLPIGEPPITYSMTKEQAQQLGIDLDTYQEPAEEPEPESPYTPDESKTSITFMRDYGAFAISGAGTFSVSGMEADLSFSCADTYAVDGDGAATASNTADALSYTVTLFGQSSEARTTPSTSIVRDGDVYRVKLSAEVSGQRIVLCEGEVPASDVVAPAEEPEPAISYTPATQEISFDVDNSTFTANGSGTMSAMGMDIPITFSIKDAYSISDDGTVRAADTTGTLEYTAMGAAGTTDPISTITKTESGYQIKIEAVINGQRVTLLDKVVSRDEIIADEPAAAPSPQSAPEPGDTTLEPVATPEQNAGEKVTSEEAAPAEPTPEPESTEEPTAEADDSNSAESDSSIEESEDI